MFKLHRIVESWIIPDRAAETAGPCKFTYIDKSGAVITDERYDDAMDYSEGLAAVRVGRMWGYIDKNGRMAIKPQFDKAYPFSDELAAVEQGRLHGYIDHKGAIVIAPQFKQAGKFSDGLAAVCVRIEDEYFYINKQGEQAIPERFTLASYFFKGLAHVKIKNSTEKNIKDPDANGSFAYIDVTGKKVFSY